MDQIDASPKNTIDNVAVAQDVVYLHGRGDVPESGPGDLVQAHAWGARRLIAPTLEADFYRQPFEAQVSHVDSLVGEAGLAIGFSYGSWLLLTVVAMRQLTERPVPDLLLLSPILGYGGTAAAGLVAPYARELRRHLGLSEWAHWLPNKARARAPIVTPERIALIHGVDDPQCATEDVRALRPLGYPVTIVDGGHQLSSPGAHAAVQCALARATDALRARR